MARSNLKIQNTETTHEGAKAHPVNAEQLLRRSVLSCLLWEDEFYEDGQSIADRIVAAAKAVPATTLAHLAVEARQRFNLRHVPLLLCSILAETAKGALVGDTIATVIQRADELGEFLAVHAKRHGKPASEVKKLISKQMKRGLGLAFQRFDEYQLAKYDRDNGVKMRDALFLCHAKPRDEEQAALWKRLIDGELKTPDTWEVALSAGADKKATFERLITEGNLGYLALLRNLRNMEQAGVDHGIVRDAILARKGAHRVYPFRFVAAAKVAPWAEPWLDQSLLATIEALPVMPGRTVVLVDVSGSMADPLSARSDMTRMHAAAALASIIRADQLRVFSFSNQLVEIPARRGMAGVDAVINSQQHGGTALFDAVAAINQNVPYDRLIVITDEQASGPVGWGSRLSGNLRSLPNPTGIGYMINVASAKNGVGYGAWRHIDGFSENVLRFIEEYERAETVR
jgi:60 kDa SS-A/Ro ribonucleoprotein